MHTFSENSSGVPAFLAKLWRLVEDEETNHLIYWSAVSDATRRIQNQIESPFGFLILFAFGIFSQCVRFTLNLKWPLFANESQAIAFQNNIRRRQHRHHTTCMRYSFFLNNSISSFYGQNKTHSVGTFL